jgi:hypothetical protein
MSLRRAGFAAFVMLVVQTALGVYVNLFVTVPGADQGHGLGQAIANGPAGLTLHILLGLLLILTALGFGVRAVLARRPALIAAAVLGLLAMIGAAASGGSFVGSGRAGASMAMAALAAVGLLCYGTSMFLLPGLAEPDADDQVTRPDDGDRTTSTLLLHFAAITA